MRTTLPKQAINSVNFPTGIPISQYISMQVCLCRKNFPGRSWIELLKDGYPLESGAIASLASSLQD